MLTLSSRNPCTPPPRANRATLPYDLFAGLPITPENEGEHEYTQLAGAQCNQTPLSALLPAPPILSPVLRSAARQRRKTREVLPPTSPLLKSPAIMNLGIFTAIAQAEDEQQYTSPSSQCDSLPTPDLGFFSPASTYATSCSSFASPSSFDCLTSPPTSYETPSPFLESAFEDLYLSQPYQETKQSSNPSSLIKAHHIHSALGFFSAPHIFEEHAPEVSSPTPSTSSFGAPAGLKLSLYLAAEGARSPSPSSFSFARFPGRPLTSSTSLLPAMLADDQVSIVTDLKREIIQKFGLNHMHVSDQDVGLYFTSSSSEPGSPELGQMMGEEQSLKMDYGLDHASEQANIVAVICSSNLN